MEYLEQVYYEFTCGTTLFMNLQEQDRTNNSIFDITEKNFEGYVGISFNKSKFYNFLSNCDAQFCANCVAIASRLLRYRDVDSAKLGLTGAWAATGFNPYKFKSGLITGEIRGKKGLKKGLN